MLSIGTAATLASIYEATARKPGNVYPGADFDETTTYAAFVKSAIAIGPVVENVATACVGRTVRDAVRATREVVSTNTNLGTLLLIAPLAAVPAGTKLRDGIGHRPDRHLACQGRTLAEPRQVDRCHAALGGQGPQHCPP